MINIRYLFHRGGLLVTKQPLCSGYFVQAQSLVQPKYVLGSTIHQFEQNCLPSNSILKVFKSTKATKRNLDEDLTPRRYTTEDDQKLLEHVKLFGKSKDSLQRVAVTIDRTYKSVASRCRKLLSSNEFDAQTDPKAWDLDDDNKLVEYLLNFHEIKPGNLTVLLDFKPNDFKDIAPEFQRSTQALYDHWKIEIVPLLEPHLDDLKRSKSLREDIANIIETRHEKKTILHGYSDKDKKFIIKQVKLKGDAPETWGFIAKKLGKKNPAHVRNFYYNHILQTPKVKGSYSPEEDEMILTHVKENGKTQESFRDLTKELGRGSVSSVQHRHKKLIASNEFEINAKRKAWELDEDKSLIDRVFNIKVIKVGDAISIENVKPSVFNAIATELKRSSYSCYLRWMQHIAPTLKTHLMKLPMTNDWKKDVLSHIVNNNIKHKKEMDIDQILKDVAPGQTSKSLLIYLGTLKRETVNGVTKQSKLPLCDLASKRFKEQRPDDPLFNENHKGEQKRLEWCQDVISFYKTLI